jgi:hypothetical protein
LGFGIGNMGTGKQPNTDISASKPAVTVTQPQNTEDIPTQEETMPQPEHKIVVHPISGTSSTMDFALMIEDFVEMTQEEMIAYYGIDYVPVVPKDMKLWETRSGIFKRNGGTGEIYWDQDDLRFSNEEQTRDMTLTVRKGGMPFVCCIVFSPEMEASAIYGTEVKIGYFGKGHYYAEFFYQNVGFMLYAEGLTQEEFVAVIASIVQP